MEKSYWTLFCLLLISMVVLAGLMIGLTVLVRNSLLSAKNKRLLYVIIVCVFLLLILINIKKIINCCKDYPFVSSGTYIEIEGKVIDFKKIERDYDGNGQLIYSDPEFYVADEDRYIILNVSDVEVGHTYLLRYYPNTKICEVVEERHPSAD